MFKLKRGEVTSLTLRVTIVYVYQDLKACAQGAEIVVGMGKFVFL